VEKTLLASYLQTINTCGHCPEQWKR